MVAPAYGNVHDLADRLGIPLNDTREATLLQIGDGASRWIERQTGRRFYVVPAETRYYSAVWTYPRAGYGLSSGYGDYPWGNPERPNGGGVASLRIAIDDFVSVSAVATDDDGDGVYETAWTVGTDYWLGPRNAAAEGKPFRSINRNQAVGRYTFPPWENGVSVTGSSGYCAIADLPATIRELWMSVAILMARPVMEMSIPGVSSFRLGNDLSVTMSPEDLTPGMQAIIDQYRDPLFA